MELRYMRGTTHKCNLNPAAGVREEQMPLGLITPEAINTTQMLLIRI